MHDFLLFSTQLILNLYALKCEIDSDTFSFVHVTPSETPMSSASPTTVINPMQLGKYQLCTYM